MARLAPIPLALFVTLFSHAARAEATSPGEGAARFGKGKSEWGVSLAHGLGLGLFGADGRDVEDVAFAGLVPRYGIGLTDALGAGHWYEGNVELLVEAPLFAAYEPKGGFIGGANAVLRYNFLASARVVPFVEIGLGVGGIELDLDDQADGLIFAPQAGLGLHCWLSPQLALTAEWRLHHLSNADIHDDNTGINDSLVMVGLSYFP